MCWGTGGSAASTDASRMMTLGMTRPWDSFFQIELGITNKMPTSPAHVIRPGFIPGIPSWLVGGPLPPTVGRSVWQLHTARHNCAHQPTETQSLGRRTLLPLKAWHLG